MRRSVLLALLAVLALVGAACGGGDEPKADAATTTTAERSTTTTTVIKDQDDLVGSIAATLSAAVVALTDEQARCLAQAIADEIGPAADGSLNELPPAVQDAYVATLTSASDACGVPLNGPTPGG